MYMCREGIHNVLGWDNSTKYTHAGRAQTQEGTIKHTGSIQNTCAGRVYIHVLGGYTCMCWEGIHACAGRVYMHVLGGYTCMCWEGIHACAGRVHIHVLGGYTYMCREGIHTCAGRVYIHVLGGYNSTQMHSCWEDINVHRRVL